MIHLEKCILVLVLFTPAASVDYFHNDALEGVDFVSMFKEKCEYTCKSGMEKVPKKSVQKPKLKGCGPLGSKFKIMKGLSGVQSCCDEHTTCYRTCNELKVVCDKNFQDCLKRPCGSSEDEQICNQSAMLMYTSVLALGCDSYKTGQKNACDCVKKTSEEL